MRFSTRRQERTMDTAQIHSMSQVQSPASARVASALSPRPATTAKTVGSAAPAQAASAAGASNITSNDFLTLLVSELKNQDPTQPADPNAYISQLVGVNSLQQLIQINQGLTSVETSGSSSTLSASKPAAVDGSGSTSNPVAGPSTLASVEPASATQSLWGTNAAAAAVLTA